MEKGRAVAYVSGTVGAIVWLVIVIVLFIIEGVTVQLICVWFAIGAFVAMLASFMGAPLAAQLVLFIITSVAVLVFGRPLLKKRLIPRKTATNVDAIIGHTGVVIEEIDNTLQTGRVRADGLDWTARSAGGGVIAARQEVLIKAIDGVKLIVEQENQDKGA